MGPPDNCAPFLVPVQEDNSITTDDGPIIECHAIDDLHDKLIDTNCQRQEISQALKEHDAYTDTITKKTKGGLTRHFTRLRHTLIDGAVHVTKKFNRNITGYERQDNTCNSAGEGHTHVTPTPWQRDAPAREEESDSHHFDR